MKLYTANIRIGTYINISTRPIIAYLTHFLNIPVLFPVTYIYSLRPEPSLSLSADIRLIIHIIIRSISAIIEPLFQSYALK